MEDKQVVGLRTLVQTGGTLGASVVDAVGLMEVRPSPGGRAAEVRVLARLSVRADTRQNTVFIDVPVVRMRKLDTGAALVPTGWGIDSVEAGESARWTLSEDPPGVDLAHRPGMRRLTVVLAKPLEPGARQDIVVSWHQTVPYARVDINANHVAYHGEATPLLPALPRLAGDDGRFPYGLEVWAPPDAAIVLSGGDEVSRGERDGLVGVGAHGVVGGQAAVVVGNLKADQAVRSRSLTRRSAPGLAAQLDGLALPVWSWTGWTMGRLDLVELPPSWGPPEPFAAEGVAGVRTGLALPTSHPLHGRPWSALPDLDTVLVAESALAAVLAGLAGSDLEAGIWVDAFARSFGLSVIPPSSALPWREALQNCTLTPGSRGPALAPKAVVGTGFQGLAARCAMPLVLGPMLDDRLGHDGAMRVRRAALAPGLLREDAVVKAVLREDPTAADWAQRWLTEGHVAKVWLETEVVQADVGWQVSGTVVSDSPLAGAPVTVRLRRGRFTQDVTVDGTGSFVATVPYRPWRIVLDPDHRLLAVPPSARATESQMMH